MFGSIGMLEILLVAGIALMVLGPDKFPEFAKLSMRTVRDIRKYVNEAQRDIATELNPLKQEMNNLKKVDVENYVENLIGDDDEAVVEDEDDDGSINLEPDASVIDDWYPEELNEIQPGDDETAVMDEESDQETVEGAVSYDSVSDDAEVEPVAPSIESGELESMDDIEGREEVVDAADPERLDG